MINKLNHGRNIFLSFPSEESINFPSRKSCLNYFDDSTHKYNPPDYSKIIEKLKKNNFDIVYSSKSYKPIMFFLIGLILEPLSKILKSVLFYSYGTWAFWGFEAIIWAKKK